MSVQWGAWAAGGMASGNAATAKAVERLGMAMIAPDQGVGAIQALMLLRGAATVTAAVPFRWGRFIQRLSAGGVPPMFEAFTQEAAAEVAAEAAAAAPTPVPITAVSEAEEAAAPRRERRRAKTAGMSRCTRSAVRPRAKAGAAAPAAAVPGAEAQREYMIGQVQEAVASVLGSSVGLEEPLMAAGLDSLGSGGCGWVKFHVPFPWGGGSWATESGLLWLPTYVCRCTITALRVTAA